MPCYSSDSGSVRDYYMEKARKKWPGKQKWEYERIVQKMRRSR